MPSPPTNVIARRRYSADVAISKCEFLHEIATEQAPRNDKTKYRKEYSQ